MQTDAVSLRVSPDSTEIESVVLALWHWLDLRHLIAPYNKELLIQGFYDMLRDDALASLGDRERALAPVVCGALHAVGRFALALDSGARIKAFEEKRETADPTLRAWLQENDAVVRSGLGDFQTKPLVDAIAKFTGGSQALRRKLKAHRGVLFKRHQAYKRRGYAHVDPHRHELWLAFWIERHAAYIESELQWYLAHLRGSRGDATIGYIGPLTIVAWRKLRDETIKSLKDHGANHAELESWFGRDAPRGGAPGAARALSRDREKKRTARALKKGGGSTKH